MIVGSSAHFLVLFLRVLQAWYRQQAREHRLVRLLQQRSILDLTAGQRSGQLCFSARGFSLHAAMRIGAEDRSGLERLCR